MRPYRDTLCSNNTMITVPQKEVAPWNVAPAGYSKTETCSHVSMNPIKTISIVLCQSGTYKSSTTQDLDVLSNAYCMEAKRHVRHP